MTIEQFLQKKKKTACRYIYIHMYVHIPLTEYNTLKITIKHLLLGILRRQEI